MLVAEKVPPRFLLTLSLFKAHEGVSKIFDQSPPSRHVYFPQKNIFNLVRLDFEESGSIELRMRLLLVPEEALGYLCRHTP